MNLRFLLLLFCAASVCLGAEISVLPAHIRADGEGRVVEADRSAGVTPARKITLTSPRAAYASCRVLVSSAKPTSYKLSATGPFEVELYREWLHFMPSKKVYYPDALVPIHAPYEGQLPDADNRVAGQTTQPFWVDIWIPADARPGTHRIQVALESGGRTTRLPIELRILEATVPDEDVIAVDHNSYGSSFVTQQYPSLARKQAGKFFLSDAFFGVIHDYHRVFYEHRGVFHQLGYGHGGKMGVEFAPRLEGSGKTKHIADWTNYDKHYGPLLDGSAFAKTRRGPKPIPFVYLPVNPEWPASFLWWGEPGYEREFVNVMREMEAHFRAKDWTHTNFELFFNHKKRYKSFHWDGDETRFPKDLPIFAEYARLMKEAFPADSPVKWVYRADVSWQMERQFKEQADIINFWVCSGGMFDWYENLASALKQRGDIIWTYGGTPGADKAASHITLDPLKAWMLGVDGFVRWQTVAPGPDPWFRFGGGDLTLVYSGDRFGIDEPIPSVRLKLQRNALQDLALLDAAALKTPGDAIRAEVARHYNGTQLKDWHSPRPALADTNPIDWTNADINDALPKDARFEKQLDAAAWDRVHGYLIELLTGGNR
ncbi:MAG: DUF4091 domain-containing protein [Bryobacterales bacterium]|nr:DUF4091 domain-containing protein [Bryobacterales bacterium]